MTQKNNKLGKNRNNSVFSNQDTNSPLVYPNSKNTEEVNSDSTTFSGMNLEEYDWDNEVDDNSHSEAVGLDNTIDNQADEKKAEKQSSYNTPESSESNGVDISKLRENEANSYKLPTTIHIVDGEKGGCGKSFFSQILIGYCKKKNFDVFVVDADKSNQDIAKMFSNVEKVFFTEDEKKVQRTDRIFDLALKKSVIVNLPAQVYTEVKDWIINNKLTKLGEQYSINFVKWFICNGVDSVKLFIQSLRDFGNDNKVTHVFVRNKGLYDNWEYIDKMKDFIEAKGEYEFIVIDLPKLSFYEHNLIECLNITFTDAITHPKLGVLSRKRVIDFLELAYKDCAKTELIECNKNRAKT
ncbi:MAG: cobalamin biosynthesis protein CobQ [Cyanobacteria bacterium P01_A01_bin.68]